MVALCGVGYLTWVYVLPPIFQAIGQILATISTIVIIAAFIMMAPVIIKGIRRFTRFLHKLVIRHDPFGELEDQKQKMLENKARFREAKGKINQLKHEMEVEADVSEKKAKELQNSIVSNQAKATRMKEELENMVKKQGKAAKGTGRLCSLKC